MQSAAPGRMTAGPSSASGARAESPKAGEHARALSEILAERIRAGGPISFAEFMRECLVSSRSRLLLARKRPPVRGLLHERRRASDLRTPARAAIRGNVGAARLASPVRRGRVRRRSRPPGRAHPGFQRASATRILCGAGICRGRALRRAPRRACGAPRGSCGRGTRLQRRRNPARDSRRMHFFK